MQVGRRVGGDNDLILDEEPLNVAVLWRQGEYENEESVVVLTVRAG